MYLCVDAGTTRLKAAIVDAAGEIVALEAAEIPVLQPTSGAMQVDMQAFWQVFCGTTQALRQKAPAEMAVLQGAAVCAQGDGCWPVEASGAPAYSAILWNDSRAGALGLERDELLQAFVRGKNSTPLFPGALPAILAWMKQEEPAAYGRTVFALHCKDWLNFQLTGQIASDYSDQSAAGLELFRREYVLRLYDRLGIPEAKGMLPPLRESTYLLGEVRAEAATQTGIPEGTPVAVGCMDVIASVLGAGVRELGDACAILGTTLCCQVLIDREQVDMADSRGSALCGIRPEQYHRVMAAQSGTAALDWARGLLAPGLEPGALDDALEKIPAGSEGALFHPYIRGERAPFRAHEARGGFYGLCAAHTPMHLLRAAYEGVAFSLRDCLEALPSVWGELHIVGGGAASDFLCRLVADTLGRPVWRPAGEELGILGVWRVLLQALGRPLPLREQEPGELFLPREAQSKVLQAQYENFIALQKALLPYWQGARRTI